MNNDAAARAALEKLVIDFTKAFNREDIDDVMSYFTDDAVYDELLQRRAGCRRLSVIYPSSLPHWSAADGPRALPA